MKYEVINHGTIGEDIDCITIKRVNETASFPLGGEQATAVLEREAEIARQSKRIAELEALLREDGDTSTECFCERPEDYECWNCRRNRLLKEPTDA